jgi:hypothetical protein
MKAERLDMDIDIVWRTPVRLLPAPADSSQEFVIHHTDANRVPDAPGLYVFARKHGAKFEPIYIGQADSLKTRLGQHLKQNVALMKALRAAKTGAKVVLIAEIDTKQGQQVQRVLDIAEPTLIAEAVAAGYSLVNKQLTKKLFHTVTSHGPTAARGPFDRTYNVPVTN